MSKICVYTTLLFFFSPSWHDPKETIFKHWICHNCLTLLDCFKSSSITIGRHGQTLKDSCRKIGYTALPHGYALQHCGWALQPLGCAVQPLGYALQPLMKDHLSFRPLSLHAISSYFHVGELLASNHFSFRTNFFVRLSLSISMSVNRLMTTPLPRPLFFGQSFP